MEYSPLKGSVLYGKIVVIRRNGEDGSIFPLTTESCLFGRSDACSIRVQLPAVSDQQCQLQVLENYVVELKNLSKSNLTKINNRNLQGCVNLNHMDIIGIVDRCFRFEYPDGHPLAVARSSSSDTIVEKVTRKSKSPSQRSPSELEGYKVLKPSIKPPLPFDFDDVENTEPNDSTRSFKLKKRRSSAASFSINLNMTKILTPKLKPPTPSRRPPQEVYDAPGDSSPLLEKRTSLRKSFLEIRQVHELSAMVESGESEILTAQDEIQPNLSGKKRKSSSPLKSINSKRKRVSFGANLSPELFDKNLPPGTPVRKGSIPKRLSMDSVLNSSSPYKGLLKRRSVAAPISNPIKEESPVRRSPRQLVTDPIASPLTSDKSPSTGNPVVSPPILKSPSKELKTGLEDSRQRRSRHVVLKSPHIAHHEMSEMEQQINKTQKKQEGAAFKRHTHSPDDLLSPPTTPASQKPVPASPLALNDERTPQKKGLTPLKKDSTPLQSLVDSLQARPQRNVMSPGRGHVVHTDTPRPRTPKSETKDAVNDEIEKIISPPIDMKKALVLRAIHGKSHTPMLPASMKNRLTPSKAVSPQTRSPISSVARKGSEKKETPPRGNMASPSLSGRSAKKDTPLKGATSSPLLSGRSARRSTGKTKAVKTTWADIVKQGKRKSVDAAKIKSKKPVALTKAPKLKKPEKRSPKSKVSTQFPSSLSTGHVDSPETFVLSKKGQRTQRITTPLKESSSMYDDLPPTPAPPTLMFVSPLSTEKRRVKGSPISKAILDSTPDLKGIDTMMRQEKSRKSVSLVGVRELLCEPKLRRSTSLVGLREMMQQPKPRASVSYTGVRELMQQPKARKSVSLVGVRELMTVPKSRRSANLTGVKELFEVPKEQRSPRLAGVKELFNQTKDYPSPNYVGVRELFELPKMQESPNLRGLRKMMIDPKPRKSAELHGLTELFKEETPIMSPNVPIKGKGRKTTAASSVKLVDESDSAAEETYVLSEKADVPFIVRTEEEINSTGQEPNGSTSAGGEATSVPQKAEASSRGRRGRKAETSPSKENVEHASPLDTSCVAQKTDVSSRGRRGKKVDTSLVKEVVQTVIEVTSAVTQKTEMTSRGRRGRKAEPSPVKEAIEAVEAVDKVSPSETSVVTHKAEVPSRGRKGKKADTSLAMDVDGAVVEVTSAVTQKTETSSRGRRGKRVDTSPVKKAADAQKTVEHVSPVNISTVTQKADVLIRGRRGKKVDTSPVKPMVESEIACEDRSTFPQKAEVPLRGIRGKKVETLPLKEVMESGTVVEDTSGATQKKEVSKKVSREKKVVTSPIKEVVESRTVEEDNSGATQTTEIANKGRRGRKADASAVQEAVEAQSAAKPTCSSDTSALPQKQKVLSRGRRGRKADISHLKEVVESETFVEHPSTVPQKTEVSSRGRRGKKVDIPRFEEKYEPQRAVEHVDESAVTQMAEIPSRGRRGKKTSTLPPTEVVETGSALEGASVVTQNMISTRGRRGKNVEVASVEQTIQSEILAKTESKEVLTPRKTKISRNATAPEQADITDSSSTAKQIIKARAAKTVDAAPDVTIPTASSKKRTIKNKEMSDDVPKKKTRSTPSEDDGTNSTDSPIKHTLRGNKKQLEDDNTNNYTDLVKISSKASTRGRRAAIAIITKPESPKDLPSPVRSKRSRKVLS